MGSSIPLAALHIEPPQQQPNALEQYARIMQIRQQQALMPGQIQAQQQQLQAGQLENQQRQQQLKDQQAVTAAMKEWDGKDFSALPSLVLKNGGSGQTVISMKNGLIKQQQDLANLSKDQLANMSAVNDQLLGHIDTLKGVTDPVQRAQAAKAQGAQILNSPLSQMLDPQTQQMVQGMAQGAFVPNDDQLSVFEKGLTAHSKQIEQAAKEAEMGKNAAQAARDTAEAGVINKYGGMGVENRELADYLAKNPGKGPMDFAAAKAKLAPLAQLTVANSQGGGLKDAALDNAAETYWATGKLPAGGRGPAVMAQNQKIMNRAAELHAGESITEGSAAYAANKRSLDSLQKNFDQVTAFENTAGKNLDVFLKTAQKVVDSGNPLINRPVRTVVGSMGGPDQAAFDAARTTALTEIAKVLNSSNASGVLSDSARHEVEGLIKPNATLQQIVSAANILKQDMANRHESYQNQIDDIRGRMRGGSKTQSAPQQNAPAKTLSMSQIQQAAKDHGVSVDEAKRQAIAAGYQVQ